MHSTTKDICLLVTNAESPYVTCTYTYRYVEIMVMPNGDFEWIRDDAER